MIEQLAPIFARTFAEYTHHLLTRRADAPAPKNEPPLPTDETVTLASAPQWVREAYEAVLTGTAGPAITDAQAAAYVIRDRLQLGLRSRGINQAELARRMGTSPAVISRVFKSPHRCRLSTLTRIARELGVEVADILRHT